MVRPSAWAGSARNQAAAWSALHTVRPQDQPGVLRQPLPELEVMLAGTMQGDVGCWAGRLKRITGYSLAR